MEGKIPTTITTVFLDTRLWKTKHLRKRFQNYGQSCVLPTDRIEIHQSQPLVWPSDLLYVVLAGCDWWISIRSVDNMYDWRKLWKCFRECFVFEGRVSRKTVIIHLINKNAVLDCTIVKFYIKELNYCLASIEDIIFGLTVLLFVILR